MSEDEDDLNLLSAIARSEGLNNQKQSPQSHTNTKYFPILKHPLPVSTHRHEHERVLRKVYSCRIEYQGIAAITLGDAWALEEVFMRHGYVALKEKDGSFPIHVAVQMNSVDCIMVLINIGVDLSKKNSLGFTPLQLAKASAFSEVEALLIQNKAPLSYDEETEKIVHHASVLDVTPLNIGRKSAASTLYEFNNLPDKSTLF